MQRHEIRSDIKKKGKRCWFVTDDLLGSGKWNFFGCILLKQEQTLSMKQVWVEFKRQPVSTNGDVPYFCTTVDPEELLFLQVRKWNKTIVLFMRNLQLQIFFLKDAPSLWCVPGEATRHAASPPWLWKIKYDRCTMHIDTHDGWTNGILVERLLFCGGLGEPRLRVKGRVLEFFFISAVIFVSGTVQKGRNEKRFPLKSAKRVCVHVHSSRLRSWTHRYSKRTVCTMHQKDECVARGGTLTDFMRLMNGRKKHHHALRFQLFLLRGLFPQANTSCHVRACFHRVILRTKMSCVVSHRIRLQIWFLYLFHVRGTSTSTINNVQSSLAVSETFKAVCEWHLTFSRFVFIFMDIITTTVTGNDRSRK